MNLINNNLAVKLRLSSKQLKLTSLIMLGAQKIYISVKH